MSAAMRWGLSVLDWRNHAINKQAEHPLGVFKAECGHLLMMVTTLHEKPSGEPCEACATLQLARAVTDDSGRNQPPRSGDGEPDDDEPDPQAWITYVGDCGHHRVMSNPAHIGPCPTTTRRSAPPEARPAAGGALPPSRSRRPAGPTHTEELTVENVAVSSEPTSDRPAFFDQLVATVEQLSATRSALRQIIALADDAPGLTDAQLRDRLTALAKACTR